MSLRGIYSSEPERKTKEKEACTSTRQLQSFVEVRNHKIKQVPSQTEDRTKKKKVVSVALYYFPHLY